MLCFQFQCLTDSDTLLHLSGCFGTPGRMTVDLESFGSWDYVLQRFTPQGSIKHWHLISYDVFFVANSLVKLKCFRRTFLTWLYPVTVWTYTLLVCMRGASADLWECFRLKWAASLHTEVVWARSLLPLPSKVVDLVYRNRKLRDPLSSEAEKIILLCPLPGIFALKECRGFKR